MADTYERIVREQMAKLPSHLRTKIPWLSSFCSLHNKINPLPVSSILEWLKDEVDTCVPAVWQPLRARKLLNEEQLRMLSLVEELNCLWTPPESKQRHRHHRKPSATFGYGSAKCGGCILAQIGGSEDVLIALGALFIGRVKESIWKRSKRIVWIESWIRDAADDSGADQAVQRMWKLSIELRELRKEASVGGRSYVDQYVRQVRAIDHERPQKQPTHTDSIDDSDHVGNWLNQVAAADDLFDRGMDHGQYQQQPAQYDPVQGVDQDDNWLNQVAAADELFDNKDVWNSLQPANELDPEQAAANGEQARAKFDFEQDLEANHLFRPTSSVYSQRSEWSRPSSHNSESQLIDLYRRSEIVESGRSPPPPPPDPPPPDRESRLIELYRHSVYTQDGRPF